MLNNKKIWFSLGLVFLFSFYLITPVKAAGASLFLSPPSATYAVGSTFSVKVKMNSGGEAINAAEGNLIFNPDEISIVSISKTGSIFGMWTTEPTFSNSVGNIIFGGGTPSGFTGSSGTIITIRFKAKANASSQVSFSSGSILAADGKGTNILSTMNGAVYTLKSRVITPPATEVPSEPEYVVPIVSSGAPAVPIVSSTTHSNPENWYSNSNPEFSWKVPTDVTAVRLLIGHLKSAIPTVIYSPPISEKKLEDLEDGTWYFHVRFKNQYGWGEILHRKILIDTVSPKPFNITVDNGGDSTNPTPILHFNTTDSLSGVEYYEVKIGEKDIIPIVSAAVESNPYQTPVLEPWIHTIIVKAVDAAENLATSTIDVSVEPIEAPVITDFPETLNQGDTLIIKGTSPYQEGIVAIFIKKDKEETQSQDVEIGSDGNWILICGQSLERGTYQVWAQIIDIRGAQSNITDKVIITVTLPTILKFGRIAIDYLSIMISLVTLIIVLIGGIFYASHRFSVWQKRLRKETNEVSLNVAKAFRALREKVQEQIEKLDKKPGLTKKEKEMRDKLQEALNISETFIKKEIEDIEKELE